MDGISAALVDFSTTIPSLVAASNTPYSAELSDILNKIIKPEWRGSLHGLLSIDVKVGRAFAKACCELIAKSEIEPESITAIGHHGQTVWHHPQGDTPSSLQIGDPNIIAEATGITVIADWRRRDIAAGGQGAPLSPAFHLYCFNQATGKAVLNLGGIANLTILSTQDGFDTGPANTLLDTWTRHCLGKNYDEDGRWARTGKINKDLLGSFLQDPYFQQPPPKSTGREKFNLEWIIKHVKQTKTNRPYQQQDIQATLTELTTKTICMSLETIAPDINEVIICGGGIHNKFLIERLQKNAEKTSFCSSSKYGVDPDYMEAMAFAWLAMRTFEGKSGNIPTATAAIGERVLGGIYSA